VGSVNGKNRQVPASPSNPWRVVAAVIVAVLIGYAIVQFGAWDTTGRTVPGWPQNVVGTFVLELVSGKAHWTSSHTFIAVLIPVLVLIAVAVLILAKPPDKKRKTDTYKAAKSLGDGSQMALKTVAARSDKSRLTTGVVKGLLLVKTMRGGKERYADWRQTGVIVAGPGAGKTTGFVVPMALTAPGVVFVTTNKRDVPDALHGSRAGRTDIFDPQQIVSKNKPTFRIDFNRYVTDEIRAHKLAKVWMDSSGPVGAKKDAYFDSAGPNLLAGHLLACAVEKLPISNVFLWLMDPKDRTPIKILEKAGYLLPAKALEGVYFAPEEQRGGVFGTAAEMVSFLNNSRVRSWLEPDSILDKRPVFSPEDFVRSGDGTMIAVSKEGYGSTGPLTAALTTWVMDAAEELADQSPHGRLKIPLVVLLDEVTNVCRKSDLPDAMSHYGSRGISTWPFLQNFAQGARVWTEDGMRQMWGAANIRIVGSGQADEKFLKEFSAIIGQHLVTEYSANSSSGKGGGGYSRTISQKERPVLDVDDIAALLPGECIVHASGDRAFLAHTIPWYEREDMKETVSACVAANEPK
jgi:type IV secretory pathway TraG/TraD family ATPase VirD4